MNFEKLFLTVQPKTFLDIGAFDGSFSFKMKNRFPDCEIIMIEANPYCETELSKLNLKYEIVGLSNEVKKNNFYIEKNNKVCYGASFYREKTIWYNDENYETIEVNSDVLDNKNYFPNRMIDLIKIDTQGSELDIINGGKKTILRSKYVLLETSTVPYNNGAPLLDEIFFKMKQFQFKLEDILNFDKFNTNQICQMDVLFKNMYI